MAEDGSAYGRLLVVATPLGNWEDLSPRALEALREATVVAAEDTRYARRLLSHYGLKTPLLSCHQHNERARAGRITAHLARGEDVALVTDAGTPGVSDPGTGLVALVAEEGFRVVPIPGPSAVTAAVSVSGLGGGGYCFLGFLPRSRSKRKAELTALSDSRRPLVMFESPRRISALLETAIEALGDRPAVLCRELTKTHEEVLRGHISEIQDALPARPLGEMVLILDGRHPGVGGEGGADGGGQGPPDGDKLEEARRVARELRGEGLKGTEVARQLAQRTGLSRRLAYELSQEAGGSSEEEGSRVAVEITFRGDPELRATHGKTLELKRGSSVGGRETCVIGVDASWDPAALKRLSGAVEVSLEVGEHRLGLEGEICRMFDCADRIVLRKSRRPSRVTLAVGATASAADLDRGMVEALKEGVTGRMVIRGKG